MNPTTWTEMVERANEVYLALGNGIKVVEENEKETSIVQRRSLRFTKNLNKGHILEYDDLFPLRPIPLDGVPPYEIDAFIGKKLNRDVISDDFLKRKDVE
jgi:N-acetylneuraminate synthase